MKQLRERTAAKITQFLSEVIGLTLLFLSYLVRDSHALEARTYTDDCARRWRDSD